MTMMRSFCKQQNIKALYHPDILPDDCLPLLSAFQRAFLSEYRGTWAGDIADGTRVKDPQVHHVDVLHNNEHIQLQGVLDDELAAKSASYIDMVRCAGHLFTTQKRGLANSSVAISANRSVGHIDKIFKHTHVGEKGARIMETFAVVRILKELPGPLRRFDHFSEFLHVTGRLVSNRYEESVVVRLEALSHCILTELKVTGVGRAILAMPLAIEMVSMFCTFHCRF